MEDYPVIKDLCVIPTDGESQYEAFQSIFSDIMFANELTNLQAIPDLLHTKCYVVNME